MNIEQIQQLIEMAGKAGLLRFPKRRDGDE